MGIFRHELFQDERRRAARPKVVAPGMNFDRRNSGFRGQRMFLERTFQAFEKDPGRMHRALTGNDYDRRIEQVDGIGKTDTENVSGPLKDRNGFRFARIGSLGQRIERFLDGKLVVE